MSSDAPATSDHVSIDLAPGTAKSSKFFDRFPRFYDTSLTSPGRGRLNLRHDAIFTQHAEIFDGARVLDIASHDGRWSFAALESGASHVTGIEPKDDLVTNANETFAHYGVSPDRYRFITGDVFDVLASETVEVDVVMCLGFFYHTLRYNELMHRIRQCTPQHLIVDTEVITRKGPLVRVTLDRLEGQKNAVADDFSFGDSVLVGRPSRAALRNIVRGYGFEIERESNWEALIRDNPDLGGVARYGRGERITERYKSAF